MLRKNLKKKTKYLLFFRLQNPYECPFNGSRRQDCACRNDYLAAGFTVFSKIRFDVASMQIKSKHLFLVLANLSVLLKFIWSQLPNYYFHPFTDPAVPSWGKQNFYLI